MESNWKNREMIRHSDNFSRAPEFHFGIGLSIALYKNKIADLNAER
jgi:hypothetical protein